MYVKAFEDSDRHVARFLLLVVLVAGCDGGGGEDGPPEPPEDAAIARCGDGVVAPGSESCDDGNDVDGDGCDADCSDTEIVQMALGLQHTCIVTDAGTVRCWGDASFGQLGYGNVDPVGDDELPASAGDVQLPDGAISVVAGSAHTCALLEGGVVRCWGRNDSGQLGQANVDTIGDDEIPGDVPPVRVGAAVSGLSAGFAHTCAVLVSGVVRCWGNGDAGRLGYGNVTSIGDDETPEAQGDVPLVGQVTVDVAAGGTHTCARRDLGEVRCWGNGAFGRLGRGDTLTIGDDEFPQGAIDLGASVLSISAGSDSSCAVLDDGTARCWGFGFRGRLGTGDTVPIGDNELPTAVPPIEIDDDPITSVTVGAAHACALLASGLIRCWGFGNDGRLGYGATESLGDDETVADIGAVDIGGPARLVVAGGLHTCAVRRSGELYCWGRNDFGQLGRGDRESIGDDEIPAVAGPVDVFRTR